MSNLTAVMIWAATYFLHSSLLLGGVWCWFRWKEPGSHAFRETVWKLAAAGGFVTASLQLGFGIESPLNAALRTAWTVSSLSSIDDSGATFSASALGEGRPASGTGPQRFSFARAGSEFEEAALSSFLVYQPDEEASVTPTIAAEPLPSATDLAENTVVHPFPVSAVVQGKADFVKYASGFSLLLVGILAAIGGALVALSGWGLFLLVSEHSEFFQRLAGCRVVRDGRSREILDNLLQTARVGRPVTLLMSDDDLEPGACGWLRWQIVLPSRAVEELSRPELRALLAHELAHLVRGDQWWLLLGRLLVVCFGWQPFNRIALGEWQRASEYLCDAWAVQRDVERLSLARCLTTVAEWRLVGMATIAGLGSGNRSNLTQRVERLIEDVPLADPWQQFGRRHLLSAIGSLVALGMVGYAPAATLSPPPPVTTATPVTRQVELVLDQDDEESEIAVSSESGQIRLVEAQVPNLPMFSQAVLISAVTEQPTVRRDSQLVRGLELIQTVQRQMSVDMIELNAELQGLEVSISKLPPLVSGPLWPAQQQQFRQRMANLQRLRKALLGPM